MVLPRAFKPASTWLPLQVPVISICFLGSSAYWLFPFQLYFGGAAFLIMYVLLLVFLMAPMMYMEMRLGGITQRGLLAMQAKYFPLSTGVGLSLLMKLIITSFCKSAYMCLPLWYMFVAGTTKPGSPYPWATCSNSWNTPQCNTTRVLDQYGFHSTVTPEEEYVRHVIPDAASHIELPHLGKVFPNLGGMLTISWTFIFLLACGGPRLFGWLVMTFGSLFLCGLIVLLCPGCRHFQTEGALDGLRHMFSPDFEKMVEFRQGWANALMSAVVMSGSWSYILPSVGKLAGKGRKMSSLAWIPILVTVVVVPVLVVILVGLLVGVVAEIQQIHIEEATGLGLTVLVLPTACRVLDLHPFFAFLLFGSQVILMALAQGLTVLVVVDSILEGVYSRWLKAFKASRAMWRLLVTVVVCVLSLLLSLPLVTQNGHQLLRTLEFFLEKLSFVSSGMLLVSLVIIYAQRRQCHLTERRAVIALVSVVGTLSVVMEFAVFVVNIKHFADFDELLFDTFKALISIGPLIVGLLLGVLYAFIDSRGTFEQRFVHIFAGNQDDSDTDTSTVAERGYQMMATPGGISSGQPQQQCPQQTSLVGSQEPRLMKENIMEQQKSK